MSNSEIIKSVKEVLKDGYYRFSKSAYKKLGFSLVNGTLIKVEVHLKEEVLYGIIPHGEYCLELSAYEIQSNWERNEYKAYIDPHFIIGFRTLE